MIKRIAAAGMLLLLMLSSHFATATNNAYDGENRLTSAADAMGNTIAYSLDPAGNMLQAAYAPSANLIVNGSFEEAAGSGGAADHWYTYVTPGTAAAAFAVTDSVAASGMKAQRIEAAGLGQWENAILHQTFPLQEGNHYEFDAQIHIAALEKARVLWTVKFLDANGTNVGEREEAMTAATSGFVPIKLQGEVPASSTQAKVSVYIQAVQTSGSGTIIVDGLKFFYPDRQNLVQNGGFEQYTGSAGAADHWNTHTAAVGTADFGIARGSDAAEGMKAQKIAAANLGQWENVILHQTFPLEAGAVYALEAQMKIAALHNARVLWTIEFQDANGTKLDERQEEWTAAASGYVPVRLQGKAPEGSVQAKVSAYIQAVQAGGSGTILLDDVQVFRSDKVNALNNGSFEQDTDGSDAADHWSTYADADGGSADFQVIGIVSAGRKAQKISVDKLGPWKNAILQQTFPIGQGGHYTFSGQANIVTLRNARMLWTVAFYDAGGTLVGTNEEQRTAATGGFTEIAVQGEAPAGSTQAKVSVTIQGTQENGAGLVIVDDLAYAAQ